MSDPSEAQNGTHRKVVHLVGRLTDGIFSLLGPATAALSSTVSEQTVVLIDHVSSRPLLTRFDNSIDIVPVSPQRNPLAQWHALRQTFSQVIAEREPDAVHLHGFIACLNGEQVLSDLGSRLPTFYSPHGGHSLGPLRAMATLAHVVGRPSRRAHAVRAIGHGAAEASALRSMAHPRVALVEGPVDSAYFEVPARPARHPLLLSASRSHDARGVEAFDQLAVLLGGDALGVGFNWIGPVDAVSAQRLKAANVGAFDPRTDSERAARLAAGWAFVALGAGRGFPSSLAEAMAVGLPCIALDTPGHRDLVRQGETGYLCRSQAEIIDRIAQLIDTPSLRERMGRAGRDMARTRFSEAHFQAALLAAYDPRGQATAGPSSTAKLQRGPVPAALDAP